MIFRQLIDADTSTLTYLIGDPWSREAVLIDPVREGLSRDQTLLDELGLTLTYVLETHVHADHVTSAALLRARTGCKVVVPRRGAVQGADVEVDDGDAIRFGLQALEVRATPGHTSGCVSYVHASGDRVFTGDALLIRGCGRTDFQEGDARTLYRSVRDKLFSLDPSTLVYPAHDYRGRTVSSIREEMLYNPRLGGGRSEDAFVAIMDELHLAYPRKIDVAVPANRRAGVMDDDEAERLDQHTLDADDWPVRRTPTGAPNVPALWVADHVHRVRVIDVREAHEWDGAEGHLEASEHIDMARFPEVARGWDTEAPLVLLCRSGGRSDRVARQLEEHGFKRVASMRGGLLQWRALGLPVEDGAQG
ncbi:MAG: MBL fold metallo-hydrolase [Alphaproteobacteria bacterium]|nr:MBL fold metallo-hydrolase [Alphaproteobacteria bacterium]